MKLPVEESEFIPCDILDIVRRIRPHNPATAVRFVEAFKASADLLARMPGLGPVRPGPKAAGASGNVEQVHQPPAFAKRGAE